MLSKQEVFSRYAEIKEMFSTTKQINQIAKAINAPAAYIHELLMNEGDHWNKKQCVERICPLCNASFGAPSSYLAEQRILCSACRDAKRQQFRQLRTTDKKRKYIISLLESNTAMNMIADLTGLTRQAIWKFRKREGINLKPKSTIHICETCQKEVKKAISRKASAHNFCCEACYFAWLGAHSFYEWDGYGSRVAREKVKQYIELKPGYIVHHINGNGTDNRLDNLEVYETQGEHLRAHRGIEARPIWQGTDYIVTHRPSSA